MNRREFLSLSAATVASAVLLPAMGVEAEAALPTMADGVEAAKAAVRGRLPHAGYAANGTIYISTDAGESWALIDTQAWIDRVSIGMSEPNPFVWAAEPAEGELFHPLATIHDEVDA